ncbi:hypothetical protein DPMN_090776 [Dreissena polymorpha]|uniref:Uncharacterized protein n=1 Tax=Dreissena polymorpha TaxID=45954 RepID=A0A9D4R035_DREPO|nr:hypothetical protein DPMN_090776 [Dreissena polymorpha]
MKRFPSPAPEYHRSSQTPGSSLNKASVVGPYLGHVIAKSLTAVFRSPPAKFPV